MLALIQPPPLCQARIAVHYSTRPNLAANVGIAAQAGSEPPSAVSDSSGAHVRPMRNLLAMGVVEFDPGIAFGIEHGVRHHVEARA
jgi:hypothetical protein